MSLFHYAEPGSPRGFAYGNLQAEALGRPDLNEWNLFVRETLQNSWDARLGNGGNARVTFAIDYVELADGTSDVIRDKVFADERLRPDALSRFLVKPKLPLLVVSDRGTHGLRGPTNSAVEHDGPTDYRSFILEFGREESKELKGGTYGVGKGILYGISQAKTILVYSRTNDEDGCPVSRFIGVTSDSGFAHEGRKYTGRHWWGREGSFFDDHIGVSIPVPEPVTGEEADNMASRLGMDKYFDEDQSTGTSIAVVDPMMFVSDDDELRESEADEIMGILAQALTRWAWPHMVKSAEERPSIFFNVSSNGRKVEVPDPISDPILRHYVRAFQDTLHVDMEKPEGFYFRRSTEITSIRAKRPPQSIGKFGIREIEDLDTKNESIAQEMINRVVLLRNPRMVVEYSQLGTDLQGRNFAAVFVAKDSVDREFAKSEPPSHDSWNPRTMKATDINAEVWKKANPVSVALTHIRTLIRGWSGDPALIQEAKLNTAARRISNDLGSILNGLRGNSPMKTNHSTGRRSGTQRIDRGPSVTSKVVRLIPAGEDVIVVFKIEVQSANISSNLQVEVSPYVMTDTGKLQEGALLSKFPRVLGWREITSQNEEDYWERPPRHALIEDNKAQIRFENTNHPVAAVFVKQSRAQAVGVEIKQSITSSEDSNG